MNSLQSPIHPSIQGNSCPNRLTYVNTRGTLASITPSPTATVPTISSPIASSPITTRARRVAADMRDPVNNFFACDSKVTQNNREDLACFFEYPQLFSDEASTDSVHEEMDVMDSVDHVLVQCIDPTKQSLLGNHKKHSLLLCPSDVGDVGVDVCSFVDASNVRLEKTRICLYMFMTIQ